MKWTHCRIPSQRDQDIYRAVIVSFRPQAEVAQLFDVSQGRVSQICANVRTWLAEQSDGEFTRGQNNFIAAHEMRIRLEDKLHTATEVFQRSCGQDVVQKSKKKNNELYSEEQVSRQGRPSHQMFREMVRLEEQIFEARQCEHALKSQLVQENSQLSWWRDEQLVQLCLGLCREIVLSYPRAGELKQSLAPLPHFDLTTLQAELRQRVAQSDGEANAGLVQYLPAEWAVLARQLGLEDEALAPAEPAATDEATEVEAIDEVEEPSLASPLDEPPASPPPGSSVQEEIAWYRSRLRAEQERGVHLKKAIAKYDLNDRDTLSASEENSAEMQKSANRVDIANKANNLSGQPAASSKKVKPAEMRAALARSADASERMPTSPR